MADKEKWITGKIGLAIGGHPVELEMTVPAEPVRARRMLPIYRKMSETFVGIGVAAAKTENKTVSCRAGCGACCRQAVPLSEIEAHEIARLVEDMPEPQQTKIRERFRKARARLAEINWLERLEAAAYQTEAEREQVILEYFRQEIACPFLENESCSIHKNRPIACREYLVTSPAENCSNPTRETIEKIAYPVHISSAVRGIGRAGNPPEVLNFIPLVFSLEWTKKNPESIERKPGQEWMADFFRVLTRKNSAGRGAAPDV